MTIASSVTNHEVGANKWTVVPKVQPVVSPSLLDGLFGTDRAVQPVVSPSLLDGLFGVDLRDWFPQSQTLTDLLRHH